MRVRRWKTRTGALGTVALTGAFVVACVHWYVRPATDVPQQGGLVVVLGDLNRGERIRVAGELAEGNRAVAVSINKYCVLRLRTTLLDFRERVCFRPSPFTTQGEARFAAQYARDHGLTRITVVTTADQVTRARLRFGRCWNGPLSIVAAPLPPQRVVMRVPYEFGATLKALAVQRTC